MGRSVGSECISQRKERIPRIKEERNETGGIKFRVSAGVLSEKRGS